MAEWKVNDNIKNEIKRFIFNWHEFPFDYWWRKRYNIPFGSPMHREMNFIDMYIEYQEESLLTEIIYKEDIEEDIDLGINENEIVKMSKQEIDEDYDNLDLSKFDK